MLEIKNITASQIIDSRGVPTLEARVTLNNGTTGVASVPSGASKGKYEALELRDNNPRYLFSKSVLKACKNIEEVIAPVLIGENPSNQAKIDSMIEETDGTNNFSKLGANAALAVSMAVLCASSDYYNLEYFKYIGGLYANTLPIPMINILNGGVHANNNLDFQEFMIVPLGAENFSDAIFISLEIFNTLKTKLKSLGYSTNVGDEGGFAPNISDPKEAIELLIMAIEASGYSTSTVKIALDIAASEFYNNSFYELKGLDKKFSPCEMANYLKQLSDDYPIISIEDGLSQDDCDGWMDLTREISDKVMLVGDDLFVTNTQRLKVGIEKNMANSILIKPNQIGTLTKTFECIKTAQAFGYNTIVSHRSGETESTLIADIAVGTNAGFIKTGSLSRGERTAKYNRLLYIEKLLKDNARYGKMI